jgi:hypothetical protein
MRSLNDSTSSTTDLLDHGHLRQFVKSSWYPAIFQIPALFLFAVIAAYLFLGPQDYGQNPGSILIWTFWWTHRVCTYTKIAII